VLEQCVGTYYSSELDTNWQIATVDGALVIRRRAQADQKLELRATDTFAVRGGTLEFARDRAGRVTGFTLNAGRINGVVFTRAQRSCPNSTGTRSGLLHDNGIASD
jgi:hypothetical protein